MLKGNSCLFGPVLITSPLLRRLRLVSCPGTSRAGGAPGSPSGVGTPRQHPVPAAAAGLRRVQCGRGANRWHKRPGLARGSPSAPLGCLRGQKGCGRAPLGGLVRGPGGGPLRVPRAGSGARSGSGPRALCWPPVDSPVHVAFFQRVGWTGELQAGAGWTGAG